MATRVEKRMEPAITFRIEHAAAAGALDQSGEGILADVGGGNDRGQQSRTITPVTPPMMP